MNFIIELQSKEHKTNNLDASTKKKHISHLTSAARLACSSILGVGILFRLSNLYGYVRVPVRSHSSVCLCAIIYVSRSLTSVLYF